MVRIIKGRTRHCCPNKKDKWSLTPPHLPLRKAVQKPSPPKSQALSVGEDHINLIFIGFKQHRCGLLGLTLVPRSRQPASHEHLASLIPSLDCAYCDVCKQGTCGDTQETC